MGAVLSPPSEVNQQMKSSTARGYSAGIHLVLRRCAVGFFAATKVVERSWLLKRRGTASIRLPHWPFWLPASALPSLPLTFPPAEKKVTRKFKASINKLHPLLSSSPRRYFFFILPTRATLSSSFLFSSFTSTSTLLLRPCPFINFIFNL